MACIYHQISAHIFLFSFGVSTTVPLKFYTLHSTLFYMARELTSSSLQRSSSYLYHLISPSSFLVLWHIVQDSLMHVTNFFSLLALSRIDLSNALRTLLGAGGGGTSMSRQCDMLSTSSPGMLSRIMIKASLNSTEQRRLRTFRFGKY